VELDFQCNALQHASIPPNGFLSLEVLNLSFNCLTTRDVEELSNLLRIRELYLGSNGIRALPPVMDRFSKLETLSLEHNSLSGHEVFNFLAMMPRLRNLNVGHNKITAFPESALSMDSKRGAGFYNLVYLNLAHNKITDEADIAFTGELHSLRRLVLYGNPLTHAAVASHDQTKLNYDPIPTLHAFIADTQRDLSVMVAYPDTKKKRHGAVAYENVEIYKMLPNDVPLPSPFRSRAVEVASDAKPKAAKPVEPISLVKRTFSWW
jgi:Leucine-rich repeat (LRR) protein